MPGPFVEGPVPPSEGPAESVAEPVIPVRPYVKGPVAVTARKVEAGAEKKKDKSLPAHARRGQGPASVDSGSEPE